MAAPSLRISVRMGLCFHICKMGAARAGPAKGLLPGLGDTHLVHPDLHNSSASPPAPQRGGRGAAAALGHRGGWVCLLAPCGAEPPSTTATSHMWTLSRYKRTEACGGAGRSDTRFQRPNVFHKYNVSLIVFPTEVMRVLR